MKSVVSIVEKNSKLKRSQGAYNFINGKWQKAKDGNNFPNLNPATLGMVDEPLKPQLQKEEAPEMGMPLRPSFKVFIQ